MIAQETVERALAAARCDDCVVIADETSSANLRWAANSLTTNGVTRSRQLTVIAIRRNGAGARAGVVSRAGVRDDQVTDVVEAAEEAAAQSSPAEDAQALLRPADREAFGKEDTLPGQPSWDDAPGSTGIGVFGTFSPALGEAFAVAAAAGRKLYGYADHTLTSTFLGSSTGLRLRHDQATGKVDLNAKSAEPAASAWAGRATLDFTDVDVPAMAAELGGGSTGPGGRWTCRRAGTRRCWPRVPWPTCSSICTGPPGRRTRWTGGRCSASRAAAPGSANGWPASR